MNSERWQSGSGSSFILPTVPGVTWLDVAISGQLRTDIVI